VNFSDYSYRFPIKFQAILLEFILFRYTGIYRPLSVSDFPVYRIRPNKKNMRVKTVRGFFRPLPTVFILTCDDDERDVDEDTDVVHD
jgi:hypothetical protein